MTKAWKDWTDKEKYILHQGVFFILLLAIGILTIQAYTIYNDYGLNFCLKETDTITENKTILCFQTSEERSAYIDSKINPLIIDYKYINENDNTSTVDFINGKT